MGYSLGDSEGQEMGRPNIEITAEICSEAERLASRGLTKSQIATALGFCRDTLRKKEQEFSAFSDAIKKGQAKGIAQVSNALYEKALSGNVTAMIFYLKNRSPSQWKDRVPVGYEDDTPTPERVEVVVVDGRKRG